MKRTGWFLLSVLLAAVPAFAQNPNIINVSPQTVSTATSSSCITKVGAAVWDVTQTKSLTLQVSGTFSGTLTFKTTTDGANWVTTSLMNLTDGSAATTATTGGQFTIVNTGIQGVCAQATAWASGTASITALLGNGGSFVVPTGSIAPSSAGYWIATANAALPNAKVLGALGSGLVFNTTTTGVPSVVVCATAGTVLVGGTPPTCSAAPVVTSITAGDGGAATPSVNFSSAPTTGLWYASSTVRLSVAGSETLRLGTDVWADTDSGTFRLGSSGDVNLARDAANTLALRNGATAQKASFYQGFTDASNYRRVAIYGAFTGSTPGITSEGAGTGAAPNFYVGAAGNVIISPGNGSTGIAVFSSTAAVIGTDPGGSSALRVGGNITLGTNGNVIWGSGSVANSATNGTLSLTNNGVTAGVLLDFGTDSTLKCFARDGSSACTFSAAAFTFNGTTGKTGATCSAFTVGGCTTSPEPDVYARDYLVPWLNQANYVVLTKDEYADFQAMRAQFKFTGFIR